MLEIVELTTGRFDVVYYASRVVIDVTLSEAYEWCISRHPKLSRQLRLDGNRLVSI